VNCGPPNGLRSSRTGSDPAGEDSTSISPDLSPKGAENPPPLRAILTRPVIVSISSHAMLCILTAAASSLIPLVWSTSVELGGLGMSPASIGLWMSWYGCLNGVVQYFVFQPFLSRFGPRGVLNASISMCALIYAMFPFENLALRHVSSGPNVAEMLLITLQLTAFGIDHMGFGKSIPINSLLRASA
jgi:hypothetical protein